MKIIAKKEAIIGAIILDIEIRYNRELTEDEKKLIRLTYEATVGEMRSELFKIG